MNYITPEMASDSNSIAEPPMDAWTIGIMLYLMIFGTFPFKDTENSTIEQQVINKPVPFPKEMCVTPQCVDFIRCCLIKDPLRRITPSAMLIHEWMLLSDDDLEEMTEKQIPFD